MKDEQSGAAQDRRFTTSDAVRELLGDSGESVKCYIKQVFLLRLKASLIRARHRAKLSQDALTAELKTTQSAVARFERGDTAGQSIGKIVDYALACGLAPLDITFVPVDQLKAYIIDQPTASRSELLFERWLSPPIQTTQVVLSQPLMDQTALGSAFGLGSGRAAWALPHQPGRSVGGTWPSSAGPLAFTRDSGGGAIAI